MTKKKNINEITIKIEGESWKNAVDKAFKEKNKNVTIPGFRKGKAPRNIFEKQYGKESLFIPASDYVIEEAYTKALEESKVVPVVQPKVEIVAIDEGKIEFKFTIISKPEVNVKKYKELKVKKEKVKVTKEEVEHEIGHLLERYSDLAVKENGAVENGNVAIIDFEGFKDGVAFEGGTAEGSDLEIGSDSFIDGFEDGLIGCEVGESVTLDLTFPEDYQSEDLAGADVTFDVTINSISEKKVPKLTDSVIADNTDYDTVTAYKESIREDLVAQNESNAEQEVRNTVFSKVVESCEVTGYDEAEVKKLVDDEFESFKETAASYEDYGYTYEEVLAANGYETEEQLKEGITEYIKNYLNQKMIIYCIAAKENITVTGEETDKLVQEYMDAYSIQTKEEVYDYLGEDYFEVSILSEKVIDFILENAVEVEDAGEATTEAE